MNDNEFTTSVFKPRAVKHEYVVRIAEIPKLKVSKQVDGLKLDKIMRVLLPRRERA